MKKYFLFISIFFFIIFGLPHKGVNAAGLGAKLAGQILLNVEGNGEAWYVNPADNRRYYLGRPDDAFRIMRELSIGISNENLARLEPCERDKNFGPQVAGVKMDNTDGQISTSTAATNYDGSLASRLSGKILLQVEGSGEAWYIYPNDNKRYYLGRPADAFRIMRELSLGITRQDLAKIHKPGMDETINQYSGYEHKTITTAAGASFSADVVTIDLANPNLKIVTDTANDSDCDSGCEAKELGDYVAAANGFAGINGSYFCNSSGCNFNYYFYPVYNTRLGVLINEDQLKYWTTGPIFAFDQNNKFYYFKDSREFSSVAAFESKYGIKLQAAIGNKPRLIQDYLNYLIGWELDDKQLTGRSIHSAMAYKDNKIYLVEVFNSTIPELADVLKTLGVEYALNLDGGGSTALWYNDEYMIGPGRDIPNAIVFSQS